jgi:hypothetical protein
MPFENGRVSFRIYSLPRALPEDHIERFARHKAPPIESCSGGNTSGWVSGRHLLDRDIRAETALHCGYLRMALLQLEKKIPPSLLKAECQIAELAQLEADGKQFLSRKERSEIRKEVYDRLLPEMPPQLKDIPFIHLPGSHTLYAAALACGKSDLFCSRFLNTMGFNLIPCAPDTLIEQLGKPDPRGWTPASFSDKVPDEAVEIYPGREFLTWLLYCYDAGDAKVDTARQGRIALLIEGPLTFYHEGSGAHQTVLTEGEPIGSPEASTALRSGKLLRKAKLTLAHEDEPWEFTIDGDEFVFRNVKLPEIDQELDSASRFAERIGRLDQLRDIFFALYEHYLAIRCKPTAWRAEKEAIRNWIKTRR